MRIRSIKPEFFDSPSTAACSPWARLLYIAMWCAADDWGVGPGNPKELAAIAFPNDDQWTGKELPCLLKEVADNYGTLFYTHRNRRYYAIPSWDSHQVTQRRAKRRHPAPDDPESVPDKGIYGESASSESSQGSSLRSQGNGKYGTGEQGNRGTGEENTSSTAVDGFDEWWSHYPKKVDKGAARRAFKTALKKTDLDTLTAAADLYAKTANPQFYKNPATWLNAESWENEAPATTGTEDNPSVPSYEGQAWMRGGSW